jgi:hypothetical protein
MARIPIETPLIYLAKRVFPDYRWLNAESRSFDSAVGRQVQVTPARQAEFDSWWAQHAALPREELAKLVDAERVKEAEEHARKIEAKERARFFHRADAAADFDYWSKMAHWSIDEAIALSLGKTPQMVNLKSVQPHAVADIDGWPASPLAVDYLRRTELAKRAVVWKQLWDPVLPSLFLGWARRLDISVPGDLVKAVEARGQWVGDWKDLHDKMKAVSADWQELAKVKSAKVDELTAELAQSRAERDEAMTKAESTPKPELSTRERDTLLKLVIGMAIAGYSHDPEASRNDAPGEIAGDLANLGIEVTDDTVRKWLKEAAATVLPKAQRKG